MRACVSERKCCMILLMAFYIRYNVVSQCTLKHTKEEEKLYSLFGQWKDVSQKRLSAVKLSTQISPNSVWCGRRLTVTTCERRWTCCSRYKIEKKKRMK